MSAFTAITNKSKINSNDLMKLVGKYNFSKDCFTFEEANGVLKSIDQTR